MSEESLTSEEAQAPSEAQDQEQAAEEESPAASSPETEAPASDTSAEEGQDPAVDWKAKFNELNDTYLRTLAETENFKKRVQRDRQAEKAMAAKDAVLAMLPVVDNLERAVKATRDHMEKEGEEAAGGLKQLLEGVELTLKQFEGALQKLDVEKIPCEIGKPFDPNLHQALFQEANAEMDEGSVLEVLQGGVMLAGQVIRPTMVKVSTKP